MHELTIAKMNGDVLEKLYRILSYDNVKELTTVQEIFPNKGEITTVSVISSAQQKPENNRDHITLSWTETYKKPEKIIKEDFIQNA